MAFWDNLADSLTGKSSDDIINKQLDLQASALASKQKSTLNTGFIIGLIIIILAVLGLVIYLILNAKTAQ